jgi:hypothetical protein
MCLQPLHILTTKVQSFELLLLLLLWNFCYFKFPIKHVAKSFETVLVRNNAEIAYIGQNDFYDSQHQYTLFLDSPVIIRQVKRFYIIFEFVAKQQNHSLFILKADQLLTKCTFDTTNASAFLYVRKTANIN